MEVNPYKYTLRNVGRAMRQKPCDIHRKYALGIRSLPSAGFWAISSAICHVRASCRSESSVVAKRIDFAHWSSAKAYWLRNRYANVRDFIDQSDSRIEKQVRN